MQKRAGSRNRGVLVPVERHLLHGGIAHERQRSLEPQREGRGLLPVEIDELREQLAEREGFEPSMGYQPILP